MARRKLDPNRAHSPLLARFGDHRSSSWRRKLSQRNLRELYTLAFFLFCALTCIGYRPDVARADEVDFSAYHRAAEFCRGHVRRPFAFDLDRRVLCFDGAITRELNVSPAKSLRPNGLFVVRSPGGEVPIAIALADILRELHATVIVYDYCFSACASYLLLASHEAFILRNTIVAWHYPVDPRLCPVLVVTKEGDPRRLERPPCSDAPTEVKQGQEYGRYLDFKFYADRIIDPQFEDPPESFTIRKILKGMFEGSGRYPDVLWTWNPRYHASTLKAKITYEAYPQSQDAVDALMARFGGFRVIYDP